LTVDTDKKGKKYYKYELLVRSGESQCRGLMCHPLGRAARGGADGVELGR
jgi:hypothetical protein